MGLAAPKKDFRGKHCCEQAFDRLVEDIVRLGCILPNRFDGLRIELGEL